MATYECEVWWSFRANAKPTNWREILGSALREVAEMVDGRRTVAIEMLSIPPVDTATQTDCIRKGVDAMKRNFCEAVDNEAQELLMRKAMPHVFDA